MLHNHRRWSVESVASAEHLAYNLTAHTWCGCNGFELAGYWFLNDTTSADGAQEYAAVKQDGPDGQPLQVESITFSWCDYDQALDHIRRIIDGQCDTAGFGSAVHPLIETPEQHGRCPLCA